MHLATNSKLYRITDFQQQKKREITKSCKNKMTLLTLYIHHGLVEIKMLSLFIPLMVSWIVLYCLILGIG
jgi:hypothetical protein